MITCLFPGLSLELVTHLVAINMSSQYSNHSQKKITNDGNNSFC